MSSFQVVRTKLGPVRGILKQTQDKFKYFSFQKIPYAQQPTNELKFKDPRPLEETWSKVLDCTNGTSQPLSYGLIKNGVPTVKGQEDCLHINVFTPEVKPSTPLPVLCWIYGGGYFSGSSSTDLYGPDFLIEKDVIVVTFNYRLGVNGFLSFDDKSVGVPGNAGLKDQLLALKWVKENIHQFGGDSDNITVFGESAGGASVNYHCISPQSKGLFKRAIMISGSIYTPWANLPPETKNARRIAKTLGMLDTETSTDQEVFGFIDKQDSMKVVAAGTETLKPFESALYDCCWTSCVPTVDGDFIPDKFETLSQNAWSKDIDFMIGGCAFEGLSFSKYLKPEIMKELDQNSQLFLPRDLRDKKIDPTEIRNYYCGASKPSLENPEIFLKLKNITEFWLPIYKTVKPRLKSPNKTFLFQLDTPPGNSTVYRVFRAGFKVPQEFTNETLHSDSLPLIWKTKFSEKPKPDEKIFPTFEKFLNSITEFAKKGNPNHEKLDKKWENVTQNDPFWSMNMGEDEWKMQDLPQREIIEKYMKLYPKEMFE